MSSPGAILVLYIHHLHWRRHRDGLCRERIRATHHLCYRDRLDHGTAPRGTTIANRQGLPLMNMLLHTLIFICLASDHLVSLSYDQRRAAWTREVHAEEETGHVLPFGFPDSKALRMPAPIPDTTVGPYPLSVPCLPKCSLLTWSLSGPFGHCRWQLPCRCALLACQGHSLPACSG